MSIVSTLVFYLRKCWFEAFLHNLGAEQQMSSLEPAKSKFPLEISLRWGLLWCTRSSSHQRSPLTRTFAEQKCLVTAKDSTFAARQQDRCTRNKIERSQKTERECLRNRKHSLFSSVQIVETPQGFQKGRGPFVELREPRSHPSNFFPAARHGASLRS